MAITTKEVIVSMEDYAPQIWTCVNCFCGLCVEGCPVFQESRNEVGAARGMALIAHAYMHGELDIKDFRDEFAYGCTNCGWCDWTCSLNTPLFIKRTGNRSTRVSGGTIAEIMRSMRADGGTVPKTVRDALTSLSKFGNPYGKSKKSKDQWAADLGLNKISETLLYVGSTVPFEERATQMAEALIRILQSAQIDISMLGGEELDSGAAALAMGEEGLFEDMVEHTQKKIKEHGAKHIICLSPHDYVSFKDYYKDFEGIDIKHYTQVLCDLTEAGKIKFANRLEKKITYHDPCYLGRKSDIYDAPRKVLQSIPGVELLEMKKTRQEAYCCGGGGTGLFHEIPNLKMNQTRAEHAKAVEADCIAVACPICMQMMDDGVKSKNYKMEVKDISQLILEAMQQP